MNTQDFMEFPKMARLTRECVITEKIDGTNAQVLIKEDGFIQFGSRTRWITPESDNFGFAKWATEHRDELLKLGPGRHFGEWWGSGIQRGYGLSNSERRFSLFNVSRWCLHNQEPKEGQQRLPECIGLVPLIYRGNFSTEECEDALELLRNHGSLAVPGFMRPEGIVVYHVAAGVGFKKTLEKDELPKSAYLSPTSLAVSS